VQTTIGKWRRLCQCASERGVFAVLAVDHRYPLRQAIGAEGGPATDEELMALKDDIVRALGDRTTAVLLDTETGAAPCVTSGALRGATGLIVAADTGSLGERSHIETGLMPGWSAEAAARIGAAGVKLLVFYHPEAPEAAEREAMVREVAEGCARHDLPFFLEPLSYSPCGSGAPLPSAERRAVVIESARRLVPLGADVLKAEFPVLVSEEPDEAVWRDACEELSAASEVPWVLLSAGVPFEVFLRQTRVACEAGASGVIAGRAVWKEAVTADRATRRDVLATTCRERMTRARALCGALARPFGDVIERP